MRKGTAYIKQKISDGVRKTGAFFSRHREVSGVTVIEMVLILVRNFTPYLGCVLCG